MPDDDRARRRADRSRSRDRSPSVAGRLAAVRAGRRARLAAALTLSAALAACATGRADPEPVGRGWSETGVASWYGPGFHGRLTASGEPYDMEAMTAAHPWLPFDTVVRVETTDGRGAAIVRINDRGPFKRGRIIDVSRAAARELGLLGPGTARVRLTVLEAARAPDCFELQVGAFREPENVRAAVRRAHRAGLEPREEAAPDGVTRVIAGPFGDPVAAGRARARLGGVVRPCPPTS